jgi:hypothetical protein
MVSHNKLMKNFEVEWNKEFLTYIFWFGFVGMVKWKSYTIYCFYADKFCIEFDVLFVLIGFRSCSHCYAVIWLLLSKWLISVSAMHRGNQWKRSGMKIVLWLFEPFLWHECRSARHSDEIKYWLFVNETEPACRKVCPRLICFSPGMLAMLFMFDALFL